MKRAELKALQSNIPKFYVMRVLESMTFFIPVLVLFWQDNGLTMTEIMILQSLFALAWVLLEIPTGYIADIFGRKQSLIGSGAFFTISVLVYGYSTNFWHFLIAETIWAVGKSLMSGSDAALLYDTLKELKREKEYKKLWGHAHFLRFCGYGLANIAGGYMGAVNLRYTFYFAVPLMALIVPVSLTFYEPKRHKRIFKKGYTHELIKILKYSLIKRKRLRLMILYASIIMAFNGGALWFYQPYMKLSGLDIIYFGYAFASYQIFSAIVSKYAYRIEKYWGPRNSLIAIVPISATGYLLMGNYAVVLGFIFGWTHQFVRGFGQIVFNDYVNKLTKSDIRATVLSAMSLMNRLFYAMLIPILGVIADAYSILQALIITGLTMLPVGAILLYILHKEKVI